jgi:lipid II:glycine glycyltransferase (peptidoglycan interpeptide bridge formation enzyme)
VPLLRRPFGTRLDTDGIARGRGGHLISKGAPEITDHGTTAPLTPDVQWDARLREHGGHMLQSWRWGDFKRRHGWEPERVLVESGDGVAMAQVLFRSKGPVSLGYIPRGPVLAGDAEALWADLWRAIDDIARRRRAISVIIEPDAPLPLAGSYFDAGVVKGPAHVQPARTVKVPLLDDDALLKQMHQKTRYNIRLAGRRGVEFRTLPVTPEAVAEFYGLMQDTSQRNDFAVHSLDYYADFLDVFGDDALLLGAWNDEGSLSAMLIGALFGNEGVYMYGASSTANRANGAGAAIQFEAMKWARGRGAGVYDLWGIPPTDPESVAAEGSNQIAGTKGEDWRGLYRFKTGFGGEIVTYPPTLERRYVPLLPGIARRAGIIAG